MNCIHWRYLSWVIGGCGIIPFVAAFYSGHFWTSPLAYIGILLLGAGVVIGLLKWRCPHCGWHISDRTPIGTKFCPHCGKSLEEI